MLVYAWVLCCARVITTSAVCVLLEKHKTYHQKDEILSKDGFKKYMKYEHCPYQGCAYSKVPHNNCYTTVRIYPVLQSVIQPTKLVGSIYSLCTMCCF